MKEQDLRDKFVNVNTLSNGLTLAEVTDKCVQIAKDYAEQEAIEFYEWASNNRKHFIYPINGNTSELYQLFKNRENER